jgi:STE24 endopeptidase
MSEVSILFILLAIYGLYELLELVLALLNEYHRRKGIPQALADLLQGNDPERYEDYQRSKFRFGMLERLVVNVLFLSFLALGGLGFLAVFCDSISSHPISSTLIFLAIIWFLSELVSTPLEWYSTFVLEEKFGFNTTTRSTFISDWVKSGLMTLVLGGLLIGTLLWLIFRIGPSFWWYFWIVSTAFLLLVQLYYTSIVLPLFNTLNPLPSGALRDAIEAYCKKVSFPLNNLYVMDGSKRTKKANAFFSGIGRKKKIVLYDTLVDHYSVEEIVSVLAHEVGHYRKKHVLIGFLNQILMTGFVLWLLSKWIYLEPISMAFGYTGIHAGINLITFTLAYIPLGFVFHILMNFLSRRHEFQADAFARDTSDSKALVSALKKLHSDSLSNLNPHPWTVWMHYSHPPLLARIQALTT